MKTLYLIRHAKSSWEFDVPDHKRPLNHRGLNDAEMIGDHLKTLIKPIDKVISSPAIRAHKTAKIISKLLDIDVDRISLDQDLYDFNGDKAMEVIKNTDDSITTLMVFGHNHAFTFLANKLGDISIDNLPTTGVVCIEFETENWENVEVGKNVLTVFPKLLRK